MFYKKWTFSLVGLVFLLALGFVLMPVLAHKAEKGQHHLDVSFQLDTSIIDVSSHDNMDPGIEQDIQIDSGRVRAYDPGTDGTAVGYQDADSPAYPRPFRPKKADGTVATADDAEPILTFLVEFSRGVPLTYDAADAFDRDGDGDTEEIITYNGGIVGFGLDDIVIETFDEFGRSWGAVTLKDTTVAPEDDDATPEDESDVDNIAKIAFTNPGGTPILVPGERVGRQFTVEVYYQAFENLKNLLVELRGGDFEIATMIFTFKNHSVTEWPTLAYQLALKDPGNRVDGDITKALKDDFQKLGIGPLADHDIRIDLVDVDEGNPQYRTVAADNTAPITPVTAPTPAAPYHAAAPTRTTNPDGFPNVVSITRLRGISDDINLPVGYGLANTAAANADIFEVKVVLTEEPAASFLEGSGEMLIDVENGVVVGIDQGLPFGNAAEGPTDAREKDAVMPPYSEGGYAPPVGTDPSTDPIPEPTGRDNQYWAYRVMIDPDRATADDVIITVKEFDDQVLPNPKTYRPLTERERKTADRTSPLLSTRLKQGREILTVPVIQAGSPPAAPDIFKPSADARLPHEKFINEKLVIPANGYLVLASGTYAQAGILAAAAKIADKKRAGETEYNTVEKFDPPYPGNDLANYFRNGATIQLVYQDIAGNTAGADAATGYAGASSATIAPGSVIINEIMWGYDRGLDNREYTEGQWIELKNTTAAPISLDKQEWMLVYGTTTSFANGTVIDTVGNNPSTGYWAVKGQSGVSSPDPVVKVPVAVEGGAGTKEETQVLDRGVADVISMSRVTGATDGTAELSWAMSILPTANFSSAGRIGTPGAENQYDTTAQDAVRQAEEDAAAATAASEAAAAAAEAAAAAGSPATAADIGITEIMVDTDDGRLPQWIELTNLSAGKVNLNGWTAVIDNAMDADVLGGGAPVTIKLDGLVLGVGEGMRGDQTGAGEGQSALLVAWATRHSSNLDQAGISARTVNLATQLEQTARYQLLSYMGFTISLMPPQAGAIASYGDVVGNLDMGWDIMMAEGGRSSLIRTETDHLGMEQMGTSAKGWRLASATDLISGPTSWYGSDEDAGTPGYDSGGPLPVELSMFYPARDKITGQVVITWETQSELNNAGFFIKRSQQRRGNFVVINPTMIPGAGTTSEKQSYTYTDTSAKPNIVYYYQIEDVSLDGQRQTLTNGIRLRGHIGAAGKATTTWGELKHVQ